MSHLIYLTPNKTKTKKKWQVDIRNRSRRELSIGVEKIWRRWLQWLRFWCQNICCCNKWPTWSCWICAIHRLFEKVDQVLESLMEADLYRWVYIYICNIYVSDVKNPHHFCVWLVGPFSLQLSKLIGWFSFGLVRLVAAEYAIERGW